MHAENEFSDEDGQVWEEVSYDDEMGDCDEGFEKGYAFNS